MLERGVSKVAAVAILESISGNGVRSSLGEPPKEQGSGLGTSAIEEVFEAPKFFTQGQLDVMPQSVHVPPLDSPEMRDLADDEVVEALVFVEADGQVSDVQIVSGNPLFAAAVKRGFLGAIFWPGQLRGRPVPSKVVVKVGYPGTPRQSRGQ